MTNTSTRGRSRSRLARVSLVLGLALVGAGLADQPASAQIAGALGKPLPSPDLPVGTVSVRVVAGSAASPIVGTEVTLLVNGAPRAARTDDAGRATFAGLPAGAKLVAKVTADKEEHASEEFVVPDSGGTRVMISTKPLTAGAGEAPFAGGGAGMPSPRQLSGSARPEQGDAPGMITVRVAYDSLTDTPEGQPVTLVGYAANDSISHTVLSTDKAGRVQFTGLDRSGGTAYFAMAVVPRKAGVDRLVSMPVVLESQSGVRMILSGEKRDSEAPAVDDLGKLDPQGATPAGKLRVVLVGIADATARVSLVDTATSKVLGEAKPELSGPDPARVQGDSEFTSDEKLPAGTLDVEVLGGQGQDEGPLKDIEIKVAADKGGLTSVTGGDGKVRMALPASAAQRATFTINGREFTSQPFDLSKSGGKLAVRAHWDPTGQLQAVFDVAGKPGQAVYAECQFGGKRYRSLPAPLLEAAGTKVTIYVFPRNILSFRMQAFVDDQQLAVQGQLEVTNYSWAPYRAAPDGLVLPLPRGFQGGVVFGADQSEVSVAAGEGMRIVRPIPPGGRKFQGGFSLPVQDGHVSWSMELPFGAFESELDVRLSPGMKVTAQPGIRNETRTVPQGTYAVVAPISYRPNQTMLLEVDGLPAAPGWRVWMPRIVALLSLVVMLAGLGLALRRPAPAATAEAAALAARRKKLLDELVELERTGANPKRREQLLSELEGIWS